ncbi:hypothetical protein LCGC14_1952620 [marine sediment metagenome]|uniref:Uncharacterized protein n=1 Tax=marine sediment metagenome TaxID=412755 RepID=A0A0F9IE19_9ZZZZ
MTYKVMGRYNGDTEELDSADSEQEAKYLLNEYRMAFGAGWILWIIEPGQ